MKNPWYKAWEYYFNDWKIAMFEALAKRSDTLSKAYIDKRVKYIENLSFDEWYEKFAQKSIYLGYLEKLD